MLLFNIKSEQGDFVFQGAYAYDITLDEGFKLKGKITHYDDDEAFDKSGYYFRGTRDIQRSLFIGDVLYTFSNKMLMANSLDNLDEISSVELEFNNEEPRYYLY
ncbi:beta-propeller domain-containing protein [Candidatus Pacearchaeota archaeon]|nr:beta-propeller domain-containing protein [Candidatus Pacearchaeota archaeon]